MPVFMEVPAKSILIKERAREELGDLSGIKESLKGFAGQIQSVAVEALEEPIDAYTYRLLAGERRVRAVLANDPDGTVGVRVYSRLDAFERSFIELTENLERKDFTWQERIALQKKVHELHVEKFGAKTGPRSEGWSGQDTATLLNVNKGDLHENLKLAKAVEKMPELAKCKSANEARKLLDKAGEQVVRAELARRHQERMDKASPSGGLEGSRKFIINNYHLGDSFDWLASQPNESADMVEIDPDYNIDFGNQRVFNSNTSETIKAVDMEGYQEVSMKPSEYYVYLHNLTKEAYRVLKPNGWCIMWFAMDPWFQHVFHAMQHAGFEGKQLPGMWCKCLESGDSRYTAAPDLYLGHGYEAFFYARKGKATINKRARIDVFHYPAPGTERTHPAEKPIGLLEDIYSTFLMPSARILIPFAGSGNGILAAANQSMIAKGCDLSEPYRNSFVLKAATWTPKGKPGIIYGKV